MLDVRNAWDHELDAALERAAREMDRHLESRIRGEMRRRQTTITCDGCGSTGPANELDAHRGECWT